MKFLQAKRSTMQYLQKLDYNSALVSSDTWTILRCLPRIAGK
ncbi:hypothetical protein GPUN_0155 [Glaciecola punicea ACAM 611]|uniref:Uncharacterized protein n=1 Tax=Glaciecola punicea ACAM 611 TaxID=1121923 RepID=H5T7N2_9ALTE|nr:hypothetical protein GPUN_0155 [Glaciecola punicea ACAM 611]